MRLQTKLTPVSFHYDLQLGRIGTTQLQDFKNKRPSFTLLEMVVSRLIVIIT